MLDTLKLVQRLISHGMDPQQAGDIAEELDKSFKESFVTKDDLKISLSELENKLIIWQFGTSFGLFCAMAGFFYILK
jgi:hypothetical protein